MHWFQSIENRSNLPSRRIFRKIVSTHLSQNFSPKTFQPKFTTRIAGPDNANKILNQKIWIFRLDLIKLKSFLNLDWLKGETEKRKLFRKQAAYWGSIRYLGEYYQMDTIDWILSTEYYQLGPPGDSSMA